MDSVDLALFVVAVVLVLAEVVAVTVGLLDWLIVVREERDRVRRLR